MHTLLRSVVETEHLVQWDIFSVIFSVVQGFFKFTWVSQVIRIMNYVKQLVQNLAQVSQQISTE